MKAVGFYKKYDPKFFYSKEEIDYFNVDNSQTYSHELVVNFLNRGKCCFGWMSHWENVEDNLFLPKAYMTIDSWIWPDYLRVLIENKRNVKLDDEFIYFIERYSNEVLEYNLDEAELFYFDNSIK